MATSGVLSGVAKLAASKLCERCQVLSIDDSDERFAALEDAANNQECVHRVALAYEVHDSLPHLGILAQSAEEEGCEFCRLLRRILRSGLLGFVHGEQNVIISLTWKWNWFFNACTENLTCQFYWLEHMTILSATIVLQQPEHTEPITFDFAVEGCEGHKGVAEWLRLHKCPPLDGFNDSTLAWVTSEMESCATSHEHSLQGGTSYHCPTRLLDIRQEPIRLVERWEVEKKKDSSTNSSPIRYAALSYCWGDENQALRQPLSTRKNLAQRLIGIPEEELSPVLRDAIEVTRKLSIPYLWVDSLCILQGDRADWEQQSAKMDEIYAGAHCTIAALASDHCGQGFLRSGLLDSARDVVHVPFHSRRRPGTSGLFSLRNVPRDGNTIDHPDGPPERVERHYTMFNQCLETSRWNSRGWTFQEDVMSTRMLVFGGSNAIFLRCAETTCFPCGERYVPLRINLHKKLNSHLDWTRLAELYSLRHRGFTRPDDVLPALSGPAAYFSRKTGIPPSEYVAGLWKESFCYDLLWRLEHRPTATRSLSDLVRRLRTSALPSWAWAGKGAVIWPILMRPPVAKDRFEVSTSVQGDNPFGEVTRGSARVTASVARVPFDLKRVKTDRDGDEEEAYKWRIPGSHRIVYLDWEPEGDSVSRERLLLLLTAIKDDRHMQYRHFYGIVVVQTGGAPGTYYRVGQLDWVEHTKAKKLKFERRAIEII